MARRRIPAIFEIIITYQMVIFCYGYIRYHNKLKTGPFRMGLFADVANWSRRWNRAKYLGTRLVNIPMGRRAYPSLAWGCLRYAQESLLAHPLPGKGGSCQQPEVNLR